MSEELQLTATQWAQRHFGVWPISVDSVYLMKVPWSMNVMRTGLLNSGMGVQYQTDQIPEECWKCGEETHPEEMIVLSFGTGTEMRFVCSDCSEMFEELAELLPVSSLPVLTEKVKAPRSYRTKLYDKDETKISTYDVGDVGYALAKALQKPKEF